MEEKNNLNRLLDVAAWEKMQNSISEATGMAILMVDYRGIPVTEHSGCREFCKRVRSDEKVGNYCQKCYARGGLEGAISQKPYIYRCHFSIVDIAIPIIIEGNYLGAIMAGQLHLKETDTTKKPEQILFVYDSEIWLKKTRLMEYYEQIPFYTSEQLEQTIALLQHLSDYFVNVIPNKEKIKTLDDGTPSAVIDQDIPGVSNRIIAQAVDYIYSTKSQTFSLTEVADYCHVSSPYLSRLFTREMGESYSGFVSKLKVTWAKEILQNTDMTIMEISEKLGFSEPGYFIKIFKKYTNETPMNYRMNKNREKNWGWYDNCEKLEGKVVSISLIKSKRLQV